MPPRPYTVDILPLVDTPTFDVIPVVAAGRHPWFYFEDGNIVLKVGYPIVPPSISVTDFATTADPSRLLQGSPAFSH